MYVIVFLGSETNTKLLLEKGADVNAQGRRGKTPLHKARTNGIVDTLLENGANPYAKVATKDAPDGPRMFTVGNCFQNIGVQCTLCMCRVIKSYIFFTLLTSLRYFTLFCSETKIPLGICSIVGWTPMARSWIPAIY